MFRKRKRSADITDDDPVFTVKYIGCTETFSACGKGCITLPVRKIWDNAHKLDRVDVVINRYGLFVRSRPEDKKTPERRFPIEEITYCAAAAAVNHRIFGWICQVDGSPRLECHAVLCRTVDKAQDMSLALTRAFHAAFKDWRSQVSKETRKKEAVSRAALHAEASLSWEDVYRRRVRDLQDSYSQMSLAGEKPQ